MKDEAGREETGLSRSKADAKITEARNLLIAEEMLARAEKAKADGDWFAVKAFLEEGSATTDINFKKYEAAVALSLEAANKVRALEEKIEHELAAFRRDAVEEKARRESAEKKAVAASASATQAKKDLAATIREKEQTSAELQIVTSAKLQAEREAARERFLKFLNELELYVNMLTRANGYLDDALAEINKGKDTSSFILLNQGKVLFDEVNTRALDLMNNRTEEQYKEKATPLLGAGASFVEAARSLGNAVFYIVKANQEDTQKFNDFLNRGLASKQNALQLMDEVRSFIQASR